MIPGIMDLMDSSEREKNINQLHKQLQLYHRYMKKLLLLLVHILKRHSVHIYNGVLPCHIKEHIWVSSSEVDEPRACYTEWSKSEREKQILYINIYIWNLEKWYWWAYLQDSNGDVDIENRLITWGWGWVGRGEWGWMESVAWKQIH